MTDPDIAKREQTVAFFAAIVLAFGATRAVFVSASEYDPEALLWLWLAIDVAMTALCGIFLFDLQKGPPGTRRKLALIAAALGLVAGLIKIGVRFSSDHGWWTGHLT